MLNIETALVQWFNKRPGSPAETFLEVPSKRPGTFITFERTGGRGERWRDRPTVAVQSWASSRVNASELAIDVVGLVREFVIEHPQVARVDIAGPYNFSDPDSKHHRYQFTATFVTV